jgi:putative nucleotidyltransferase with HDIG domain
MFVDLAAQLKVQLKVPPSPDDDEERMWFSRPAARAAADTDVTATTPLDGLRSALAYRMAAGHLDLPMLPRVASQVVSLVGNAKSSATQLADLIHRDPALAGHVLKIANSPAYMPRMPIVSLQQAVARLGFGVITEIAFAASVQSGIFRVPGYEKVLVALWRHALAAGAFAKEIARVRRSNVESAFLCGLLHGVGKPALLQITTDVAKASGLPLDEQKLHDILEDLHTVVGMRIAEQWGLPKQVSAAIEHYANYGKAGNFKQEAMTTRLADRLATHLLYPEAFASEDELRDDPVFADLNLYPDQVSGLLAKRELVLQLVDSMTV